MGMELSTRLGFLIHVFWEGGGLERYGGGKKSHGKTENVLIGWVYGGNWMFCFLLP